MSWLTALCVSTVEPGGCMGSTSITRLDPPIATVLQTLAPNDVSSTRWQRLYLWYLGFIFVQREEAQTRTPSIFIYSHCLRQTATVSAGAGSTNSPLFWWFYPHWFSFDKNHMSVQLFHWHCLPSLLCSINPDYQFPGALCPLLRTCSADLT